MKLQILFLRQKWLICISLLLLSSLPNERLFAVTAWFRHFQEPLLEDTAEYIKQFCLTHLSECTGKGDTVLKSLWMLESSCSLHTQYFHFPLSPPNVIFSSDLLEVVVDKEAITARQEIQEAYLISCLLTPGKWEGYRNGFTDRVCRVRQRHSRITCFPWLSTTSEPHPNPSAPDNQNTVSECPWDESVPSRSVSTQPPWQFPLASPLTLCSPLELSHASLISSIRLSPSCHN